MLSDGQGILGPSEGGMGSEGCRKKARRRQYSLFCRRGQPGGSSELGAISCRCCHRLMALLVVKRQVIYQSSLEAALELLSGDDIEKQVETIFVIGGGQVYREAIASPSCAAIHLTRIEQMGCDGGVSPAHIECDTFFPALDPNHWRLWSGAQPRREGNLRYSFLCFTPAGTSPPAFAPGLASSHEELQVWTTLV